MAGTSKASDASRLVQGLFTLGITGRMSDGQLLERFLAHRDEGSEAAFEELMNRHGPMVLRVCRGVLRDHHDAEDAFQAAFLVLAHQAGSIRRRHSLASWLFGVAQRVAAHAKLRAASGHEAERTAASKRHESYESADDPDQLETLQEEIARLPDHLRAPITLCYLEGLDYREAAVRLGLSEGAVRGRLARAGERLRRGLVRRGAAVSATLMLAGEASQAQPAVPASLVRSTLGIASGFITGKAASTLARGVIRSMFLRRLKTAMVLLTLGVGSGFWALHILAAGQDSKEQRISGPQAVPDQKLAEKPKATYRLTGSVRVEGTGQPIAGVKLEVQVDSRTPSEGGPPMKEVKTGTDGMFGIDVPRGNARVWLLLPPPGYWLANTEQWLDDMAFGPESPMQRRDYLLRRGTTWVFRVPKSPGHGALSVVVWSGTFRAMVDDQGLAHLTLPSEGGRFAVALTNTARGVTIDTPPRFQPDRLKDISSVKGKDRHFRLTDTEGRSATILAPVPIEPINENGRLTIRVAPPVSVASDDGELVGQVVDPLGRPIAEADLALSVSLGPSAQKWKDKGPQWTTDEQGRYALRGVPRHALDGRPARLNVMVTKRGFAPAMSPEIRFDPAAKGKPLEVAPIRLQPGVELRGVVVDHRELPVVGAWVHPTSHSFGSSGLPLQAGRTDEKGRFVSRNLFPGPTGLAVSYGKLKVNHSYLADGSPEEVRIQLPAQPEAVEPPNAPRAPLPQPLAVGQPAPEWLPGTWSDGRLRTLAEQRNRVIVLYYWNISDSYSVSRLPVLAQLRNEFEPRGVFFLAIHGPGEDEKQVRRILAFKKTPLLWAMDLDRQASTLKHIGVTAWQYGLESFPLVVGIDKDGKVAFRGDPRG